MVTKHGHEKSQNDRQIAPTSLAAPFSGSRFVPYRINGRREMTGVLIATIANKNCFTSFLLFVNRSAWTKPRQLVPNSLCGRGNGLLSMASQPGQFASPCPWSRPWTRRPNILSCIQKKHSRMRLLNFRTPNRSHRP